ncbi:hypothetical protein D3C81_1317530 [compost metagenome]
MGVHVAHQHLVTVTANQLADVAQLQGAGLGAKCQVHHHHDQRIFTLAKTHQDRTTPGRAGQRVIFEQLRLQAAEHAIAVLGETPEVAVELLVPVGEGPQMSQVLDLIYIA